MTAVSIRGLGKTYPGQAEPVLTDFDLEIASGRLTALLGPSGCGKTTLLKTIAGLLDPTSGDIAFDGDSILPVPAQRRDVVMVYQNHLLFPHLDVAGNVGFGLRMRGVDAARIASEVAQALQQVKLPGLEGRMPASLSGGQQQRVALARALVVKPRVLLLDEPLSNLDAHLRLELRDLIIALQRQSKVTCVFVTHDQQEAVELADEIALILDQRLQQHGPPASFYEKPATMAVARFFGAQNFLAGQAGDGRFRCALGAVAARNAASFAGPCTGTIRPEDIEITTAADGDGLPATVVSCDYLGTSCRLQVAIDAGDGQGCELAVTAQARDFAALAVGSRLAVRIDPQRLWLLPGDETA